jgi:hypothetical protein
LSRCLRSKRRQRCDEQNTENDHHNFSPRRIYIASIISNAIRLAGTLQRSSR